MAAALNFIVDPLQLFRPARLFAAMYSPDSRMQDAGLIRSQDFDTVFMGTSLAIHFRQSDIDRMLGVPFAETGDDGLEFATSRALCWPRRSQRHPKRVIWEMDDWIFRDAPDIDADIYLPADLYRRNVKGVARLSLQRRHGARIGCGCWRGRSRRCEPTVARLTNGVLFKFPLSRVDDINVLRADVRRRRAYNAKEAMAAFAHITDSGAQRSISPTDTDYDAMVRNFERDAIGLIAENPDVTFDIYFPPYSILQWVAMRDASPATLKIVYDFTAYVSRRLAQFPNVSLHDFREAQRNHP